MKSLTAICQTNSSTPAITPNGRITRHPPHRGDGENAEIKMYLSKLKNLVPFMPKNRKLSKLEIIQHVIDYICDLQSELETHPDIGKFNAVNALNFSVANISALTTSNNVHTDVDILSSTERLSIDSVALERLQQQPHHQNPHLQQYSSPVPRQPLVDRQTPNTILPPTVSSHTFEYYNQYQYHQQQQSPQMLMPRYNLTSTADKDTRPELC